MARAIDSLLILVAYVIGQAFFPPVGLIAGLGLAAFQDAWGDGESIGKKMMGLRVIDEPTEIGCSFSQSLERNLPFVVAVLFLGVPPLRFLAVLAAIPLLAFESYLIFVVETGVRLGDVLGNTLVVERLDGPNEGLQ